MCDHIETFKEWFGVQRRTAAILGMLLEAGDKPIPWQAFSRAFGSSYIAVRVQLCWLRQAMTDGAVETIGSSYRLTDAGRREVQDVLERARREDWGRSRADQQLCVAA